MNQNKDFLTKTTSKVNTKSFIMQNTHQPAEPSDSGLGVRKASIASSINSCNNFSNRAVSGEQKRDHDKGPCIDPNMGMVTEGLSPAGFINSEYVRENLQKRESSGSAVCSTLRGSTIGLSHPQPNTIDMNPQASAANFRSGIIIPNSRPKQSTNTCNTLNSYQKFLNNKRSDNFETLPVGGFNLANHGADNMIVHQPVNSSQTLHRLNSGSSFGGASSVYGHYPCQGNVQLTNVAEAGEASSSPSTNSKPLVRLFSDGSVRRKLRPENIKFDEIDDKSITSSESSHNSDTGVNDKVSVKSNKSKGLTGTLNNFKTSEKLENLSNFMQNKVAFRRNQNKPAGYRQTKSDMILTCRNLDTGKMELMEDLNTFGNIKPIQEDIDEEEDREDVARRNLSKKLSYIDMPLERADNVIKSHSRPKNNDGKRKRKNENCVIS